MMDVLEAVAELERFKTEISLAEVAYAYGYELDRKESSLPVWSCAARWTMIKSSSATRAAMMYFLASGMSSKTAA